MQGGEQAVRPAEPEPVWDNGGKPFCGAGRLVETARLLLGVASSGKLLLRGTGPDLPVSGIAHCMLLECICDDLLVSSALHLLCTPLGIMQQDCQCLCRCTVMTLRNETCFCQHVETSRFV